jgi:threonine synthase
VDNIEAIGIQTSRVYAANILGAAIGADASSFVPVPNFGVTFTLYLAAALNLTMGTPWPE